MEVGSSKVGSPVQPSTRNAGDVALLSCLAASSRILLPDVLGSSFKFRWR